MKANSYSSNFGKSIIFLFSLIALSTLATSCLCSSSSQSRYVEDDKYWESISREKELKDAGLDGAATIERKARQEYMKGNGYTSPDGGQQVHYNGSLEQQRDLDAIDEYMRTHPDF